MKATRTLISPAKAKKILETSNNHNRHLRMQYAQNLADQMLKGKWQENGETLIFSKDDTLLDGQHRLMAVVIANKPQHFLVVKGIDQTAIKTIDTGQARKLGDILQIEGFSYATCLAAAYRLIFAYKELGYAQFENYRKKISAEDAIDFLHKNKLIMEQGLNLYKIHNQSTVLISPSVFVALNYLLKPDYNETLNKFYNRAQLGLNIDKDCPTGALRQFYVDSKLQRLSLGLVPSFYYVVFYFNAFSRNEKMKTPAKKISPKLILEGAKIKKKF